MDSEKIGTVVELFYASDDKHHNCERLELDTFGVKNDKFYNKNINRSVLLTSLNSYKIALEESIDLPYGSLGENILIDYNLYHLLPGAKLSIGALILEISQNCTICNSLSEFDIHLPKLLQNDRGIFAKVLVPGSISRDDTVILLDNKI